MLLMSTWEAGSRLTSQDSRLVWSPVHIITSCSLRYILILSSQLRRSLTRDIISFLQISWLRSYISNLPHSCYIYRLSHLSWFDYTYFVSWRIQIMRLLVGQFCQPSVRFLSVSRFFCETWRTSWRHRQ